MTLASAIITVPSVLLSDGFGTALVQRENVTDDHINVAFWANLFLSAFLVAIFMIGADFAAEITHTPMFAPFLRVLSLTMIPFGISSVMSALFLRKIQYRTFALRTFIAQSSGAIIGVIMALFGFGVWALAAVPMTYMFVSMLVLWIGAGWRPKLSFSMTAFHDIFQLSYRTMIGDTLRLACERADVLIIGIFLSPAALGFYYLAQRLLFTISSVTIGPVESLLLPVLSRMQNDRRRLPAAYVRMLWAGACLWVPAVAGLGATASHGLIPIFGNHWAGAVALMMVMSLGATSIGITRPTRQLLLAVDRAEVYAALNVVQLVLTIALFLAGVQREIIGAGWAFVAVSALIIPFHIYAAHRYAEVSPREILWTLLPIFGASAIMTAAVYSAGELLNWGHFTLIAQVAIGALVYSFALYGLAPVQTRDLISTIYVSLPARLRIFPADQTSG